MQKLAAALKRAAQIREESYDKGAAELAAFNDGDFVDFNSFYGRSLHEAAMDATLQAGLEPRDMEIVYMLLRQSWNESLDWANGT